MGEASRPADLIYDRNKPLANDGFMAFGRCANRHYAAVLFSSVTPMTVKRTAGGTDPPYAKARSALSHTGSTFS